MNPHEQDLSVPTSTKIMDGKPFIVVCMRCHAVKCPDGSWLPLRLMYGDGVTHKRLMEISTSSGGFSISHGICDVCYTREMEALKGGDHGRN